MRYTVITFIFIDCYAHAHLNETDMLELISKLDYFVFSVLSPFLDFLYWLHIFL